MSINENLKNEISLLDDSQLGKLLRDYKSVENDMDCAETNKYISFESWSIMQSHFDELEKYIHQVISERADDTTAS